MIQSQLKHKNRAGYHTRMLPHYISYLISVCFMKAINACLCLLKQLLAYIQHTVLPVFTFELSKAQISLLKQEPLTAILVITIMSYDQVTNTVPILLESIVSEIEILKNEDTEWCYIMGVQLLTCLLLSTWHHTT